MKHKMVVLPSLAMRWWFAGFLLPAFPASYANAEIPQQSVTTPALDQLRAEHQHVLDGLNAKNSGGRIPDLDDPRVPELLKMGWDLAGAWAAAFLENHPTPSKQELQHLFDGFAPEPRGAQSEDGDFLEYPDYNFTGSAVRIGDAIYVVEASYFSNSSTGTFMVVACDHDGHFQALWNIKDLAEKH
jgi:hypothetical protein